MSALKSIGLFVTLVDNCNLDCKFCKFPGRKEFRNGRELDCDRFLNAIRAAKNSPIPLTAVSYCGSGEPLLYGRLGEIVTETKRYVPQVSIVTNGVALNEEISKKLLSAEIDHIVISITGISGNTYEKYQGSGEKTKDAKEQLSIVKENVKRLIALRDKKCALTQVGISYILSEESKAEYFEALNYWRNIGVNYVDTRILSLGFSLSENEFEEDIKRNAKWWWESCCTCFGKVMNVFTDGRIGFCNCAYREETILGNIFEKSIGEIISSQKFKSLSDAFIEDYNNIPAFCKTCDLRRARPILA